MENIILSLLLIKSMTIYEIKMCIQKSLNTICSDSLGSIQSAIKKLLGKGCILVNEYQENSMTKKEYSITTEGLAQFQAWIETPMNLQKVKNMEEAKFFFLGMAPKETRLQSLLGYINSLKEARENLLQIQEHVKSIQENVIQMNVARISQEKELTRHLLSVSGEKTLERAVQNIYDYQIYNLEYGLKRVTDDIDFYQKILTRELEGGSHE